MESPRPSTSRLVAGVGLMTVLTISSMLVAPATSADAQAAEPARRPVITRILQRTTTTETTARVSVFGRHFDQVQEVRFGSMRGRRVRVLSPHLLRVTAPHQVAGRVRVRVVTRAGVSSRRRVAHFTYRELPIRRPAVEVSSAARGPGSVDFGWTPSRSFDAATVVIRRARGRVAPSSPHDGTPVGRVPVEYGGRWSDSGLRVGQRYAYAFFTQSSSGVYSPSRALVTWIPRGAWLGHEVDPYIGSPAAVSCVSSGFCVVGDRTGHVVTYDGSAWSDPVKIPRTGSDAGGPEVTGVTRVSCGSVSFCVAATSVAAVDEVSYYDGTAWSSSQALGNGLYGQFEALSCAPGTTTCMAALPTGHLVRYDGSGWTASGALYVPAVAGLSCATATYCLAVSADNQVFSFSGGAWSGPTTLDPAATLHGVSCTAESDCVVLARTPGAPGHTVSYHLKGDTWHSASLAGDFNEVACVSTTWCLALGSNGETATFDGTTWSAATPVGTTPVGVVYYNELACATPTECIALESPAAVLSLDGQALAVWQGSSWAVVQPDPFRGGLADISCSTPGFCVTVDGARNALSFDGTTWSKPDDVDSHPPALGPSTAAVSCPSAGFCAAIFGNGYAATFDGSSWAPSVQADSNVYFGFKLSTPPGDQRIDCASSSFCVAIDWTNVLTYNGSTWSTPKILDPDGLYDVSCPKVTFCVAVDGAGRALTFNGKKWSTSTKDLLRPGPAAISCPNTSFCLAVAGSGRSSTWDGRRWSHAVTVVNIEGYSGARRGFAGVSCASSTACTAYDYAGAVNDFDGQAWSAAVHIASRGSDPFDRHLNGLSCPTTGFCQAVSDQNAYVLEP